MKPLPCPYCGSEAGYLTAIEGDALPAMQALAAFMGLPEHCRNRSAATQVECENPECQAAGPFLASAEQAVEAWNRVAAIVRPGV